MSGKYNNVETLYKVLSAPISRIGHNKKLKCQKNGHRFLVVIRESFGKVVLVCFNSDKTNFNGILLSVNPFVP